MKKKIVSLNLHLFEQEQLCAYFHSMALQGWMLTKIYYSWVTFTKTDPQDVTFVIDIYTKGNYLNPYLVDNEQVAYSEFIEEYGYELITRTSNFQIYRINGNVVPIHNEESRDHQKIRKKTIIKYELYNHAFVILLALLFLVNPLFHFDNLYIYENNGAFLLRLFPLLFILSSFLKAGPTILWLIRQDRYHTTYQRIVKRERYFYILWWIMMITMVIALLNMNTSANFLVYMVMIIAFTMICFYGLDLLFSKFLKKFHGLLSFICTLYLLFLFMTNSTLSIMLKQPSGSMAEQPALSIRSLYPDITTMTQTETDEKDSIFLHSYETWEEYPALITDEEDPMKETAYFHSKIYTVKDTILSDYLKELILQEKHQEANLIKEHEDWTWLSTKTNTNYILKGNNIIILDDIELTENQITVILAKLHI